MTATRLLTSLASVAALACSVLPVMAQDVVKIAALPYMSQGVISIGIAEGFFEAEGIIVEPIEMRGSGPILPGLLSGGVDLALTIPSPGYFNSIARGNGMRIVAPGVTFDPDQCDYGAVYGRQGVTRSALADSDGQTFKVSATPDSYQEYLIGKLADLPDIGEPDFEYGFVPPYSTADAMNNGALDMSLTAEPWITRLDAAGTGQVVAGLSELLPDGHFTYLVFSERLLQDEPDLGMRAKRAIDAAIARYNEGKTDRNVKILADYTGLDANVIEQACWAYVPVDGAVNMPSVMAYQTWLQGRDLIDELLPADRLLAEFSPK